MATVLLFGEETALTGSAGEVLIDKDRYVDGLAELLPRGRLWDGVRDEAAGTTLRQVVKGLSIESERIDQYTQDLLRARDPAQSFDLLEAWEEVLALPESGAAQTDQPSRQAAAHEKFTSRGGSSPDFIIEQARKLGYTVVVEQVANTGTGATQSRCGVARCGANRVHSTTTIQQIVVHAPTGLNDAQLEAAINRFFHLHAQVVFVYDL